MSWKKEIKEISLRKKLALSQGGKEAIDIQHAKGRLTLRERIDLILDKNSFEEVGKISGGIEHKEDGSIDSFTPANFILGFGEINKRKIVIGGEDFTVKGLSLIHI